MKVIDQMKTATSERFNTYILYHSVKVLFQKY